MVAHRRIGLILALLALPSLGMAIERLPDDKVDTSEEVSLLNSNLTALDSGKLDVKPKTIIPKQDSTYNLGASGTEWANLYVDTVTARYITVTQTAATDSFVVTDGATNVLKIYDGGNVDIPLMSGARAFKATNVTNGVGTSATKVALSSETYDLQGEFDSTTNNRFVAVKAGYYRATGQVESTGMGAANIKFFVYLYKNGSENTRQTCQSGGTADISCNVTDTIQLAAADYIELYTSTNAAAAKDITGGSGRTYLVVEKIR